MKHFSFLLLIATLFSFMSCCVYAEEASNATASQNPIQVALYVDEGTGPNTQYIPPIVEKDPAFKITKVNGQQIRDGILDQFDIIIMPGGSGLAEAKSLQPEGVNKVKNFIKSGKCYLGICAGAFFPIQQQFFNASFKSSAYERGKDILKIEMTDLGCKVFGEQYKGEHDAYYANGPVVNINVDKRMPFVEVLAWYRTEAQENNVPEGIQIDSPAIMITTYGKGTVLTFSVHPERSDALNGCLLSGLHHLADNSRFGKPADEVIRIGENAKKDNCEAQRKDAVDYMRAMAEIEWIPQNDIVWFRPKDGVKFHAGEKYKGLPYTQGGRYTTKEEFEELLKMEDGKPIYTGPIHPRSYRGSDCSSSVSMAWVRTIPQCPVLRTARMNPGDCCLVNPKTGKTEPMFSKVGSYTVPNYEDTADACKQNGKDVMFGCYDQLLPGDAIVRQPHGHVRMVVRVDAKNKMLYTTEQTGLNPEGNLKSDHQSWRVDYGFSYEELFNDGYLPITPNEYNK